MCHSLEQWNNKFIFTYNWLLLCLYVTCRCSPKICHVEIDFKKYTNVNVLMKLPDSVFVNCYRWQKFPLMWLKAVKQKKKLVGTSVLSVAKPFILSPCWRTTAKRFMARSEYTFATSAIRPLRGQHISRYLVITVDCSLNSFCFGLSVILTKGTY